MAASKRDIPEAQCIHLRETFHKFHRRQRLGIHVSQRQASLETDGFPELCEKLVEFWRERHLADADLVVNDRRANDEEEELSGIVRA